MKPLASDPFTSARHELGVLHNRTKLELAPMTAEAANVLGPALAAIGPWAHYGFPPAQLTEQLAATSDGNATSARSRRIRTFAS